MIPNLRTLAGDTTDGFAGAGGTDFTGSALQLLGLASVLNREASGATS